MNQLGNASLLFYNTLTFANTYVCSWTETFLSAGGYSALLTRLNEILEVEWRSVLNFIFKSRSESIPILAGRNNMMINYYTNYCVVSKRYPLRRLAALLSGRLVRHRMHNLFDFFSLTRSRET